MTNEEQTIANLKKLKSIHNGSYGADIDRAIKALDIASCIKEKCAYCPHCENCDVDDETLEIKTLKPCNDCISREEAIKATYGFERYTGIDEAPYEYAESILRDLPPVTPKPKIGKWMPHMVNDKFESIDHDVCSECHTCFYGERTWDWKYCPNCGAKMEVKK